MNLHFEHAMRFFSGIDAFTTLPELLLFLKGPSEVTKQGALLFCRFR